MRGEAPCRWFELLTQDIDKAMKFYDGLFGWRSSRVTMGEGEPYPIIHNGDQSIGGYRKGPPRVKNHWVSYLSVPDVDAAHNAAVAAVRGGGRLRRHGEEGEEPGRASGEPTQRHSGDRPICHRRGHHGYGVSWMRSGVGYEPSAFRLQGP